MAAHPALAAYLSAYQHTPTPFGAALSAAYVEELAMEITHVASKHVKLASQQT
jgi:hypothetical protein